VSWVLNNVTTEDAYEDETTLLTGTARRLRVAVNNAAIFRQCLISRTGEYGNAQWEPEAFLAPGTESLSLKGLFGVRVRSAVSKTPAQVTIQIWAPDE
jgi:hypothetical protein